MVFLGLILSKVLRSFSSKLAKYTRNFLKWHFSNGSIKLDTRASISVEKKLVYFSSFIKKATFSHFEIQIVSHFCINSILTSWSLAMRNLEIKSTFQSLPLPIDADDDLVVLQKHFTLHNMGFDPWEELFYPFTDIILDRIYTKTLRKQEGAQAIWGPKEPGRLENR